MTKISKLPVYPLKVPVASADYVIGTDGITKQTRNFSMASIAQYVSDYINSGGNLTALLSVESINIDDFDITITNALYMIKGVQVGPVSGVVTETPATDNYYRTDLLVADLTGTFSLVQGIESETAAITPVLPDDFVLIATINLFGNVIGPEVPTLTGWKTYQSLVFLKRVGNFNPNIIQEGDTVWGVMSDGNTLIKGGVYMGTGGYFEASNYYANPEDISEVPATNTP